VIILFTINYSFLDKKLENFLTDHETEIVERVIDGDTIVITPKGVPPNVLKGVSGGNKTSVRLLGINTPEKGEIYYSEAKEFLEEIILDKTIKLEFGKDKYDRYKRILAYVFFKGENINLKLVEEGFANFYFPSGKDSYYNDFKEAWEKCIENNKNLCEKSINICAECIELKNFGSENQEMIFYNKCSFNCELTNWKIKDEGRKNFVFPKFILGAEKNIEIIVSKEDTVNNQDEIFWKRDTYVWTKSEDTLFLRDEKEKLVLWKNY
jgi:micrococcal nuclease